MKKLIALLLALTMALCFVACGDDEETAGGGGSDKEITGEVYDAGNVSALVPDGWKAFPVSDMWSEEEGAMDPYQLNIIKGGQSDLDMLSKPYIQIVGYEPDSMGVPSKDFYDAAEDVDPITTGGLTWEGFRATGMLDSSFIILWTTNADGYQFQVTVYDKTDNGNISLTDADVQAILGSITNS